MQVQVYNKSGQPTGRTVELPEDIFGIQPNEHVLYLSVKQYLASLRSGTHKAKEKSELSGSTRKLHKQKGTGGSRKGSIKNPLFRGGARVFGPRPRDYSFKLNKKVKTLAKVSALSSKFTADQLRIVEDFNYDQPRTKQYIDFLAGMGIKGRVLHVLPDLVDNLYLSGRNIPGVEVSLVDGLNVYEILNASTVLLTERTVELLKENLSNN